MSVMRHSWAVQLVYKRYASLYFVAGIEEGDNELITLEVIHHFVEVRTWQSIDNWFLACCEELRGRSMSLCGCFIWLCFSQVLDRYFGNVCELDLIFNFHKARLAVMLHCCGLSYEPP